MKRILIVDDSPVIRRTVRALLEGNGWVVCGEAENGADGIDQAQRFHPDLIVIDLVMPVLNGIDATRLLKQLMPAIPILMFTTFVDPHITKAALAVGVLKVIDKSEGTSLLGNIQQFFAAELPPPSAA